MDSLLKYSQLAKALDVSNASVSMAIKNGKLFPEEGQKRIDITQPLNKLWIEAREKEGKVFDINRIYKKNNDYKPLIQREDDPEEKSKPEPKTKQKKQVTIEDVRKIEVKKKAADLQKTLKETEKLELQIKKIEGELIPYDESEFLLNYIIEKIRAIQIQEIDGMASVYKARFKISHEEYIEVKQDILEIINNSYKGGMKDLKSGIEGIKDKYTEVRGRGERK